MAEKRLEIANAEYTKGLKATMALADATLKSTSAAIKFDEGFEFRVDAFAFSLGTDRGYVALRSGLRWVAQQIAKETSIPEKSELPYKLYKIFPAYCIFRWGNTKVSLSKFR